MLVNKYFILTISIVILGSLTNALSSNNFGTIKEEGTSPIDFETGNLKVQQKNSPAASSSSSLNKKLYSTNKEFVFEDDDESSNESKSSSSDSVAPLPKLEQSAKLLDSENMLVDKSSKVDDSSSSSSSANKQQQQHHNIKKSNEEEESSVEDTENVNEALKEVENEIANMRKQRVDQIYLHKLLSQSDLKNFHRQQELQRKLLHEQNDRYNFDYEQMLLDQLLNDDSNSGEESEYQTEDDDESVLGAGDVYDTSMNVKELGYRDRNNKLKEIRRKLASQSDLGLNKISENSMDNIELNKKPVVNTYEYKEKTVSQDEYNNKLKNKDPFFDTKVLSDNDLQWTDKLVQKQKESVSIDSNPAAAQKQLNQHHEGDNISAKIDQIRQQNDWLFIFIVTGCSIAGVVAIVAAGVCWFTVHRNSRSAVNIEYGVKGGIFGSGSGSIKSTSSGDKKLAQSAQMYHYQHQKQQMIAMEKANNDTKQDDSDNSDGETPEGDYTVYECPGLAPTGEMEVKNPLFKEDFSASNNNIFASPALNAMPPAYSTVASSTAANITLQTTTENETIAQNADVATSQQPQLVQIENTNETKPNVDESSVTQKQ